MNNRLPAVTLRLLANCILRKRIQMNGKTSLQHTQLNVDRIMMNDGPEAVLKSPLSTLVSASARDPSALDCTKTTNFQKFDVSLLCTRKLKSTSRTPCTGISKHLRSGDSLPVNLLGYRQTKLLDSTRIEFVWTNLTAQEVEFEVDNVDSN